MHGSNFEDFYKRVNQLIIIHSYRYFDEITMIEKVVSNETIRYMYYSGMKVQ